MAETQYSYAVGRRKTATAQVRLISGKGQSTANGIPLETYIKRADLFSVIYAPLKTAGLFDNYHFDVKVVGSGEASQAGAIRHAIARALVLAEGTLKNTLKGAGFLTRDARKVERKKPGHPKARKSPSWSKR